MNISFTSNIIDPSLPAPIPASKSIPEWYKNISRYIGGEKKPPLQGDGTAGTIKTCMPVLDAITNGYLILSSSDVYIRKTEEGTYYTWANNNLVTFHSQEQAVDYPKVKEKLKDENIPKFTNPWIIETPKGYSCLFVTPMHRDLPFTILPGVVDTDTYFNAVNFPFIPDPDFEGLIPRGTPIAQVIPFRRDSWNMSIDSIENSKKKQRKLLEIKNTISSMFFDKYKKNFWTPKDFR